MNKKKLLSHVITIFILLLIIGMTCLFIIEPSLVIVLVIAAVCALYYAIYDVVKSVIEEREKHR